jgi:hypothetical protein
MLTNSPGVQLSLLGLEKKFLRRLQMPWPKVLFWLWTGGISCMKSTRMAIGLLLLQVHPNYVQFDCD